MNVTVVYTTDSRGYPLCLLNPGFYALLFLSDSNGVGIELGLPGQILGSPPTGRCCPALCLEMSSAKDPENGLSFFSSPAFRFRSDEQVYRPLSRRTGMLELIDLSNHNPEGQILSDQLLPGA